MLPVWSDFLFSSSSCCRLLNSLKIFAKIYLVMKTKILYILGILYDLLLHNVKIHNKIDADRNTEMFKLLTLSPRRENIFALGSSGSLWKKLGVMQPILVLQVQLFYLHNLAISGVSFTCTLLSFIIMQNVYLLRIMSVCVDLIMLAAYFLSFLLITNGLTCYLYCNKSSRRRICCFPPTLA
jgi:hypothetical protein